MRFISGNWNAIVRVKSDQLRRSFKPSASILDIYGERAVAFDEGEISQAMAGLPIIRIADHKMVIIRPTKKLRSQLPIRDESGVSDSALGDWYVNRVVVARQPLLMLVSSTSLLPMVVPARDVRSLPERLPSLVEARLHRLGVQAEFIAAELRSMPPVVTAATVDRSVLGTLTDFAKAVPYYFDAVTPGPKSLSGLEAWLAQTPCHSEAIGGPVVFPDRKALDVLRIKWLADMTLASGRMH